MRDYFHGKPAPDGIKGCYGYKTARCDGGRKRIGGRRLIWVLCLEI